jgi:hypothetical protein
MIVSKLEALTAWIGVIGIPVICFIVTGGYRAPATGSLLVSVILLGLIWLYFAYTLMMVFKYRALATFLVILAGFMLWGGGLKVLWLMFSQHGPVF